MFEKLIQICLTDFLEVNSSISPKQFGVRPECNTAQALLSIVDKYHGLTDGSNTDCRIFLDRKKGFRYFRP